MIEVNDKNEFIKKAIKEADRVLSVSQIVPTAFLKDFNDKLEGIIWRINKEDDTYVISEDDLNELQDLCTMLDREYGA